MFILTKSDPNIISFHSPFVVPTQRLSQVPSHLLPNHLLTLPNSLALTQTAPVLILRRPDCTSSWTSFFCMPFCACSSFLSTYPVHE